jgi:hypothetical protein
MLMSTEQRLPVPPPDEGGLRPPPGLSFWRRVWWWFDFVILVKLARLRFVAILVVIGVLITQWDTLIAYYERWTRPAAVAESSGGEFEWFCPMHPAIVRGNSNEKCPICFMPLSKRKKGAADAAAEALPDDIRWRRKRPLMAPLDAWLRGSLPSFAEELLSPTRLRATGGSFASGLPTTAWSRLDLSRSHGHHSLRCFFQIVGFF